MSTDTLALSDEFEALAARDPLADFAETTEYEDCDFAKSMIWPLLEQRPDLGRCSPQVWTRAMQILGMDQGGNRAGTEHRAKYVETMADYGRGWGIARPGTKNLVKALGCDDRHIRRTQAAFEKAGCLLKLEVGSSWWCRSIKANPKFPLRPAGEDAGSVNRATAFLLVAPRWAILQAKRELAAERPKRKSRKKCPAKPSSGNHNSSTGLTQGSAKARGRKTISKPNQRWAQIERLRQMNPVCEKIPTKVWMKTLSHKSRQGLSAVAVDRIMRLDPDTAQAWLFDEEVRAPLGAFRWRELQWMTTWVASGSGLTFDEFVHAAQPPRIKTEPAPPLIPSPRVPATFGKQVQLARQAGIGECEHGEPRGPSACALCRWSRSS